MFPGNFAQLPPVEDKPVYAFPSQSSSLLAQHGPLCFRKYSTDWKQS